MNSSQMCEVFNLHLTVVLVSVLVGIIQRYLTRVQQVHYTCSPGMVDLFQRTVHQGFGKDKNQDDLAKIVIYLYIFAIFLQ